MRAWTEYIDTTEAAVASVAARVEHGCSLSLADLTVLRALAEADEVRLRSSSLAAVLRWTRARLSHQLARMEARHLIARESCLSDGRGVEVVLTALGTRRLEVATPLYREAVEAVLGDALSGEELHLLLLITRRLRARLSAGAPEAEPA